MKRTGNGKGFAVGAGEEGAVVAERVFVAAQRV